MITIPTCLVLGAGASVPYGFSAGRVLVEEIVANAAKPNHPLNTALEGLRRVGWRHIRPEAARPVARTEHPPPG